MRTRIDHTQKVTFTNQLVLIKLAVAIAGTIIALLIIFIMIGISSKSSAQSTTSEFIEWKIERQGGQKIFTLKKTRGGKYFSTIAQANN